SLERRDGWSNDEKWEMISHVWVDMVMYAASHCGWKQHTHALAREYEEESVAPALPCVDCGLTGEDGAVLLASIQLALLGRRETKMVGGVCVQAAPLLWWSF
ncbi:hypothetical protein D5086_011932, partial [Populus alba]